MQTSTDISRRAFMLDLGKGTLAVAVFGFAAVACSSDESDTAATTAAAGVTSSQAPTTSPATTSPATTTPATTTPATTTPVGTDPVAWERVVLGSVSAYVLARAGEATIVDTGNPGSEDGIRAGLVALDLDWADVGHVIVTHLHPDHQGSLPGVLNLAPDAAAYAGAADIPQIPAPRDLIPVGDGDTVFDLEIIETPGHTPGHICVLDPAGGLLVAGDALNGRDGGVIGANPRFTTDVAAADDSVRKLAQLTFGTVVFGHGDPVEGRASEQVATLAASL